MLIPSYDRRLAGPQTPYTYWKSEQGYRTLCSYTRSTPVLMDYWIAIYLSAHGNKQNWFCYGGLFFENDVTRAFPIKLK